MFISFEGIEGSGKSTMMLKLSEYLRNTGESIVETREPGGSALGRRLRAILLDVRSGALDPMAELFLFMGDRAQHVEEFIRPALAEEQTVFCDRFADSTIAYQGYGRGMDTGTLREVNNLATGGLVPDKTLLFDVPVQIGLERAGKRNRENGAVISEGRFDSESIRFHERVRAGYLALARENPERIVVIDASRTPDQVLGDCVRALKSIQIQGN